VGTSNVSDSFQNSFLNLKKVSINSIKTGNSLTQTKLLNEALTVNHYKEDISGVKQPLGTPLGDCECRFVAFSFVFLVQFIILCDLIGQRH